MNVDVILTFKGRDVFTIEPDRTVAEAAGILANRGIGAVVVCSADGDVRGILSERDIVRAIAEDGVAALQSPVSRHMTGKVVTARPETSVQNLMEQMTQHRFRHMPILAEGRLAGLVSIGDVVRWHVEEIESEHKAMREYIAHT